MDQVKLKQLNEANEGNFYDTRSLNFEMDKNAAVDDYGLTRVPANWRFSPWQVVWSLTGFTTALAFPLTGALLTLAFGATAVILGFLISAVIVGFCGYYTAKLSANEGVGKDLMSRSSFGYHGSVLTSIVVGLFVVMLFAMEGAVIANSLSEYVPILPYWLSAAIVVLVLIPLGIYGMVLINKIQNITLWLYVIGIILTFVALYGGWSENASADFTNGWWKINPSGAPLSLATVLAATGAWLGAFGLIMIFTNTDFTRMARRNERKKAAALTVIVSSVLNLVLAGMLGIFLLASTNMTNPDPGVTFVWLLGPIGLILVLITQIRIIVLDFYQSTLAFETSFSQLTNKNIKRSWLLVPIAVIGYLIMLSPFLQYFTTIASILGAFFASWVGALFGESLLVRRRYGIPKWREFRRAYLPSVNWIGFISLVIPTIFGISAYFGALGAFFQAASVLATFVLAFILPAVIAGIMGKEKVIRQYFARMPEIPAGNSETMTCSLSGVTAHKSDFVQCPFHNSSWISSTACASEKGCGKVCQTTPASVGVTTPL